MFRSQDHWHGGRPRIGGVLLESSPWSLPEWVTVISAPLTLAALVLAWRQLHRTRTALEEATKAARQAALDLTANYVLLLISDLERLIQDLEAALDRKDGREVIGVLTRWRLAGVNLRGLLRTTGMGTDSTLKALTASFALITDAKAGVRRSPKDLDTPTMAARRSMEKAIDTLGDVSAELKAKPKEVTRA